MKPSEQYQRITAIFIAVCNLAGGDRIRALDALCAESPELRAEVELLLTFHDKLTVVAGKHLPGSEGSAD